MTKSRYNIFMIEKPCRTIIALNKGRRVKHASKLSREVGCESYYMARIIRNLHPLGVIEIEEVGNIKPIRLTDKGKKIAEHLQGILLLLPDEKR